MVVRKAAGTLTKQEKSIVKALLQKGWRNQDIQALLNKPSEVCSQVSKKTKKKFSSHNHTQATNMYKVRPKGGSNKPEPTDMAYCIYHPAYKSYTYSDKWVDRLCTIVTDETEFSKLKAHKL